MKKIISILTATRAEYGLLKPVISKLNNVDEYDVRIVATGMHLSTQFGLTYREIEEDGFTIDKKIPILSEQDTPNAVSKAMAAALTGFADYFEELKPDLLLVLGDRYETLAVCIAAMNLRVPIAHLYGGETTEGAIDESIRHAITKMSYLHFTSTEEYRRRVIQLGEAPNRVFTVGALGIENIKKLTLLSKTELEESISYPLDKPYGVITFHPVTLEENQVREQFLELTKVCARRQDMKFIFTKANSDAYGSMINDMIDTYIQKYKNGVAFTSLGTLRYLSALKYCAMVIGNSSSGLIEAPSFGVPTINIGDRQKGRLQSSSVINCEAKEPEIEQAIKLALSEEFVKNSHISINPYGDGDTSDKIVWILNQQIRKAQIDLKKSFYNIEFEVL